MGNALDSTLNFSDDFQALLDTMIIASNYVKTVRTNKALQLQNELVESNTTALKKYALELSGLNNMIEQLAGVETMYSEEYNKIIKELKVLENDGARMSATIKQAKMRAGYAMMNSLGRK